MTINKFQGRTREEAVDKAKKEMGEAVVIMNVKEISFARLELMLIITYQKVPENGYGNQIAALKVIQKHKKERQATVLNAPVLTGE